MPALPTIVGLTALLASLSGFFLVNTILGNGLLRLEAASDFGPNIESKRRRNNLPLIVTTWANPGFVEASKQAWNIMDTTGDRLEAVLTGCSTCERLQCDRTVGYGGSPDETGETTLDAMVFDGPKHRMGAVADLRGIKDAVRVAKCVMDYTKHSLLVGESATAFATEMGFERTSLQTNESQKVFEEWTKSNCQPNYRQHVTPDPNSSCGPYKPSKDWKDSVSKKSDIFSHDTIGIVAIDEAGDVSAGTSSNGATHKVPGRVGDAPIPGAGAYVDNDVGGAAATGDGDVMVRFLPRCYRSNGYRLSFKTVEAMRQGSEPNAAATVAIKQIAKFYPDYKGAVIAADKQGRYGAACHGIGTFSYCVANREFGGVQVVNVTCADVE